jgi:hypothetical protein
VIGPRFSFDHIERMSDHRGLFEHAAGTVRRREHGYCTDDNARLLVVASRETTNDATDRLSRLALHFVLDSNDDDGRVRNRMNHAGQWTDRGSSDDCWGRALWGLGVATSVQCDPSLQMAAQTGFERCAQQRSVSPRAMAFAALGAADVVAAHPGHVVARSLLADTINVIGRPLHEHWPWPEARLAYANAALAEALIAAGAALERHDVLERGLAMLAWLLELETRDGHLSVAGVGGRGRDDIGPQFDQQPIEAAAMADGCWRAFTVTGDSSWLRGITLSVEWFCGANDAGLVMHDDASGGGFDGLGPRGVNQNQGAESTLAFLSTVQRARACVPST